MAVLAVHFEGRVGCQVFRLPDIVAPPQDAVIFGFVAVQAAQAGPAAGLAGQVEILRRSRVQDRVDVTLLGAAPGPRVAARQTGSRGRGFLDGCQGLKDKLLGRGGGDPGTNLGALPGGSITALRL